MILQIIEGSWNYESILTPLIEFLIILFIILFATFLYVKVRIVPFIVLITLVGIIICAISITNYNIPITPVIQLLAILYLTLIFLYTMLDYNKKRK